MRTHVIVVGDKKLQAKFRRMQMDAAGPLLDTAVRVGAEMIRTAAAMNAPKERGALARSIVVEKVS